jgi:V8-like Glu-specific endopeptidase
VVVVVVLLVAAADRMGGRASSTPVAGDPAPSPTGTVPSPAMDGRLRGLPAGSRVPAALLAPSPADPPSAVPFIGLMPQVGALFRVDSNGDPTEHFCSGSVVDSPHGDVIATAAHCVVDPAGGQSTGSFAFVPGYHDGRSPYGVWAPVKVLVDPRWSSGGDPDYDVAFVVLRQVRAAAGRSGHSLESLVGADAIAFGSGEPGVVGAVGYPASEDRPIACLNATRPYNPEQSEFDCGGFEGGTSGGPLLRRIGPATGTGTLVGVIGGYEQGGDSAAVSYAAHLDSAVRGLFRQALAAS